MNDTRETRKRARPQPPARREVRGIASAFRASWSQVARDVSVVVASSAVVALSVNALRGDRLPLVATGPFETLVPCPEPIGQAEAASPDDARVYHASTLLVDARCRADYLDWHLPGAVSFPFDWLAEQDEVDRQTTSVARAIARTSKRTVVVYGDGDNPDSGQAWAALLSSGGIKNVLFVIGGAPALKRGMESAAPKPEGDVR